jgi:predicted permease
LFSAGLSLVTVILFGLAPARTAWTLDLHEQLKGIGRTMTASRYSTTTVAVQVALAVLLLAVSGMMLQTFWNLDRLNPGFDRAHVIEFNLDPSSNGYSASQTASLLRELKQNISQLPAVRAVGFASMGLMRGIGIMTTVTPQGKVLPQKTFLNTSVNRVSPEYFASLGIPLLAGRLLDEHDDGKKPNPVVINERFARFFFPHENPIGRAIVQGVDGTKPPTDVVVGVVGTAKYRSLREHDPPIYYSLSGSGDQDPASVMYVRTFGNPEPLIDAVRGVLRRFAPGVPIIGVHTLEQEVENTLWQERLVSILCAFFAITALILSATGLYGALAYAVAQRSRELGVRIAIGAQTKHILETVCVRLVVALAGGIACGLVCALLAMRLTQSLVFGVLPNDPISLAGAIALLLISGILAAALPAWRATRIDPALTLRAE